MALPPGGSISTRASLLNAGSVTKTASAANVKDYGAVGNGVADDTAAIQAAMNAQRDVYLPNGTYKTTGTLSIPTAWKNGFSMVGETILGTNIKYTGTGACFQVDPSASPSSTTRRQWWYLANLYIQGPGAGVAGSVGLWLNNAMTGMAINCQVLSFETGIKLDGMGLVNGTAAYYNSLFDVHSSGCTTAVWFAGQANSNAMFGGRAFSSVTGVLVDPVTNNINLHGVAIESNSGIGIRIAGYGCQVFGCRLENPSPATFEVVFDDSGGGVNGTKSLIASYFTEPTPAAAISWDANRNNIVLWPGGGFNDPPASASYTQAYASLTHLSPSNGSHAKITATGDLTLVLDTTNVTDNQTIRCSVLASGTSVNVTPAVAIKLTTGLSSPFSIPSGKVGLFEFRYSVLLSAWVMASYKATL